MKKSILLSFLLVMLFATPSLAERWICFESKTEATVTYNKVTVRVQGDCLGLGICSGTNNSGLPSNCFEAQGSEWNDSSTEFVRADATQSVGNRIIALDQTDINLILASRASASDSSLRGTAKSGLDGVSITSLQLKALVKALIDEINILRQQVEDISSESNQITNRNLPPRTLSQAKTVIKNAIDSGSVDSE